MRFQSVHYLYLLAIVCKCQAIFNLAGPYVIRVEKFEHCDDSGTNELKYTTRMYRTGPREKIYRGNWTFPYDLDDDTSLFVQVAKWGAGGWGINAYAVEHQRYCTDTFGNMIEFDEAFFGGMGLPIKCPIPAGSYYLREMKLNFTFKKFPAMPYGKYRNDVSYIRNGVKYGCFRAIVTIEEVARSSFPGF